MKVGLIYRADGGHQQPMSKRISMTNKPSWSCSEFSPNGILPTIELFLTYNGKEHR
jgi:hypothetical protein